MGEGKIDYLILLSVLFFYSINVIRGQQINVDAYKSELFIQKVSPDSMSWSDTERMNDFHCLVKSAEGSDLPAWISAISNLNSAFIYGVVPRNFSSNITELLVSFTSLLSYRSKYYRVIISVLPRHEYASHEIQLRVTNVNIQEMLMNDGKRDKLIRIFEEKLWPEAAGKLYVTHMADPENEGFQLPPDPRDTLGVIINLGTVVNFSTQLYSIQNQTKPLAKNCPPSFHKRISVENYFSPRFIIDWCYFKLVNLSNDCVPTKDVSCEPGLTVTGYNDFVLAPFIDNEVEILTIKEEIPTTPIFKTLLTLVIVPSIVLCVFITCWLVFIMCLQSSRLRKQKEDERSTLAFNEYDPKEGLFHF